MLIGVILHAEFISAMKTVQNSTIFMKNAKKKKKIEKWMILVISVNFLRFSLRKSVLSQILQKYAYWGNFACRIHICNENSSKFYDFHEKCKQNRKMNNFGNFC